MRLYVEAARLAFLRYATYRAATFAGLLTNGAFGFLRAYVFMAVFAASPQIGGYTLQDAITYTWLTQAIIMVVFMWGWWEIADAIRTGDIVTEFQRPVDLQFFWLAQDLGRAAYHVLGRGVPTVLMGALFFEIHVPQSPMTWPALAVSVTLSVTISFSWRLLINLAAFWLKEARSVGNIGVALLNLLSGFLIPLSFFPEPWQSLALALPFAGIVAVPIDVWLEKVTGFEVAAALAWQAGWSLAMLAAGRVVLALALRRIEIHGG